MCRGCRLFDVLAGDTQVLKALPSRSGSPFAISRAVVSVIARNNKGHIHDCANQAPPNASRASQSSARLSAFCLNEGGKGSRPSCVLGRPADPEIVALLLWANVRDEFGRATPSTRTAPDGSFPCPVILFQSDDRAVEIERQSCWSVARGRLSGAGGFKIAEQRNCCFRVGRDAGGSETRL